MAKKFELYNKLVRFLKKNHPTPLPIKILRRPRKIKDGVLLRHENHFTLYIDNKLNEKQAIETLLHEYAHALSWTLQFDSMEQHELDKVVHLGNWGIHYGEIYTSYEKEFC